MVGWLESLKHMRQVERANWRLYWLGSRKQRVVVECCFSYWRLVTKGVPCAGSPVVLSYLLMNYNVAGSSKFNLVS